MFSWKFALNIQPDSLHGALKSRLVSLDTVRGFGTTPSSGSSKSHVVISECRLALQAHDDQNSCHVPEVAGIKSACTNQRRCQRGCHRRRSGIRDGWACPRSSTQGFPAGPPRNKLARIVSYPTCVESCPDLAWFATDGRQAPVAETTHRRRNPRVVRIAMPAQSHPGRTTRRARC
jgi:hypothetical protein